MGPFFLLFQQILFQIPILFHNHLSIFQIQWLFHFDVIMLSQVLSTFPFQLFILRHFYFNLILQNKLLFGNLSFSRFKVQSFLDLLRLKMIPSIPCFIFKLCFIFDYSYHLIFIMKVFYSFLNLLNYLYFI